MTVVIPVWDELVGFLNDCIASVLAQGPGPQVLVVDNASRVPVDPGSARYMRLPTRVTVGAARNAALEAVDTAFVLFLDVDDLLLPEAISRLGAPFGDQPELAITAGRAARSPGDVHDAPWGFPPIRAFKLQRRPRALAFANIVRNHVPTVGCLLRTEAVRGAGGFSPTNRGEDWALSAILAFVGRVRLIDEFTLVIRVRENSMTSRHEALNSILASRREVRRRVSASPLVPSYIRVLTPLLVVPHMFTALRRRAHRHARI